jgi:DeoR family glycerol-3-phosphate regulon repressor
LIVELLRERGRVEVSELARRFEVSEDSIRRDLRLLVAEGLARKAHGGAVAVQVAAMGAAARTAVTPGAKRGIAEAALAQVSPHHTLFVDAGSTTLAFAQALRAAPGLRPLTVITASYDVFTALADDPQIRLVLAGGLFDPISRSFAGAASVAMLSAHRADLAVLGACALHPRLGLTSQDPHDAALKRAMVEGAARRVLLSDATKLDSVAPHAVCDLAALDLVISDEAPAWLTEAVQVERI